MDTLNDFQHQFCGSRLPCGLCRLTNQLCPYANTQPNVVLCEQGGTSNVYQPAESPSTANNAVKGNWTYSGPQDKSAEAHHE